jgi:N-acetylmuramic acid 6-phosphate etherase
MSKATLFLGIECGATRTVALLADARGQLVGRAAAGPANLRLLNDAQLAGHFRGLSQALLPPAALAIGMAGARTESDRERIRRAAGQSWPGVPCYATNDLETGLMANKSSEFQTRVLILSGTGSCCFGRRANGKSAKVGGWGHLLGDKASGYDLGLQALRAVVHHFDREGALPPLGRRLLRALQLNEPEELVAWTLQAAKPDVAALAVPVFAAWRQRDKMARDLVAEAASRLAADAAACARRLVKPGTPVQFVLAGGVLLNQPRFARAVAGQLRRLWPKASVTPLERESAWGAVALAKENFGIPASGIGNQAASQTESPIPKQAPEDLRALATSPTEQRNPRSLRLDRLSISQAISLMLGEDAKIPAALLRERPRLERAIELIVRAFRRGGRLFYVGAGTSGRLGVLDASECPPTFQVSPELVQGIIAGGQRALWESIEGAEDDAPAGARALEARGVTGRDVVVGIAASGRTPFVWGALKAAQARKAATVLLTFNPRVAIPRDGRPRVVIAPNVGPEVLTGSTRLKAGTATKLVLNLFTTLAMVRLGKVISNLMVDVKASNTKLRDRATRILQALTGLDYAAAQARLVAHDWQVKAAYKDWKRDR